MVSPECAPAAKAGGLGDVVYGLSRELEIRGHAVEIVMPKYASMRSADVCGLQVSYEQLWVPWYGGAVRCVVWFGFVHGRKCFFIEPHPAGDFFGRDRLYGYADDAERFAFFSKAALEFMAVTNKRPDVIHCHDWHTGLVPVLLYEQYREILPYQRVCYTIHNFRHQGMSGPQVLWGTQLARPDYFLDRDRLGDDTHFRAVNLMKGGVVYSNFVTTVSPNHAGEALFGDGGFGLAHTLHVYRGKFGGVLNGVDYNVWNPEVDPFIPARFSGWDLDRKYANKEALRERFWLRKTWSPIVAYVGRLDEQKGMHQVHHAAFYALASGAQFVLLGDAFHHNGINGHFRHLQGCLNDNPDCHLEIGYSEELAHLVYAGADLLVVPSTFEPCGLVPLMGMRYGTVPVVRAVGGMVDTVFDRDYSARPQRDRNGYAFHQTDNLAIESALSRALGLWFGHPGEFRQLMGNCMRADYSWARPGQDYLNIYEYIRHKLAGGPPMDTLAEYVDGLPNLCGQEPLIREAVASGRQRPAFPGPVDLGGAASIFAVALHMHQPLIPAAGDDIRTAGIISNLGWMMEHQDIGDNHNAPVFAWCYKRMGEFIRDLIGEGRQPRVMLDYSGTLLHGMRQMGLDDVFDALGYLTRDTRARQATEWLGSTWGHAVAPSTPVQDYRLHVTAWQHHFAAFFGLDALGRVRGFSPAEMALPNQPDVAYQFVRTLRDAGYDWLLVQEHTVEQPDGSGIQRPHLPHRLVCTDSHGNTASIIAVVKTQGSDTKLVGQMQPYYEAKGLGPAELAGRRGRVQVPPLVTQIADGENGGVMMNEFPPKYFEVIRECSGSPTPAMNVTEYLEALARLGIGPDDLPPLQPLFQHRVWERFEGGDGPERLAAVIGELSAEDGRFHMQGGSWTSDVSWVRGYRNVLAPMERASSLFSEHFLVPEVPTSDPRYRRALFHLLACETSCYRYWGQGTWTDYGAELARRASEAARAEA